MSFDSARLGSLAPLLILDRHGLRAPARRGVRTRARTARALAVAGASPAALAALVASVVLQWPSAADGEVAASATMLVVDRMALVLDGAVHRRRRARRC